MKDFQLNLETFRKTPEDTDAQQSDEKKFPFGQRAPRMVHESDVSQCMKCWKSFGFGSSKHHCKSCGIVICSQCGAYQTVLEYRWAFYSKNCFSTFLKFCKLNVTFQ